MPSADGDVGAGIALRLTQAIGQRYRIERELGRGGMAVVFLARDLRHDRRVAIKVLLPEASRFLGKDRFLREIHIAAQLNHPHILPLHDSGEADGLLFYVMPFVEADSLRRRLERDGPLLIVDAVRVTMEVADGLEYAHRHGVVHRDIKPENILLTQSHAVIADFGIARPVAKHGGKITTTGISLGTPDYMSPEQAAADPALDHRTDIYALGCVLYEMLTGKSPFPGPTPFVQAKRHLADAVPSARALRREVPSALDAVVQRAMAKDTADRFASAAEFGEVLGGFVIATGRGAAPFRPAVVRHWRALAAAIAVLAGVGVLLLSGRGRAAIWPADPVPVRVVVRRFDDRSGHMGELADRLTESLTALLQPVRPALEVAAYAVVSELGNPSFDSLRARFAPARFVVGNLESAGDSLRVRVQVLDAATSLSVGDTSVVVASQPDLAAVLAEPLGFFVLEVFAREQEIKEREAMVPNKTVWALVKRAEQSISDAEPDFIAKSYQPGFHALDLADSLLREAQRRDGASILIPLDRARVEHSRAFYVEYLSQMMPVLPAGLPDPATHWSRARATLDSLIRRHRGLAEAYELRGRVKEGLYSTQGVDSLLDGAIADYQAATEFDRRRASAWQALSSAYLTRGQYHDALPALKQAIEQDVFHSRHRGLLRSQFDAALLAGEDDIAEAACRNGAAEAPGDVLFRDCELQLWSRMRGDRRLVAKARAKADSLARTDAGTLAAAFRELWIAEILASAGLRESADTVAQRAIRNAPVASRSDLFPEAAYLRLLRGDSDSAVALVRAAVQADPTNKMFFRSAPWFQPLQADPRFIALVGGPLSPR